MHKNSQSNTSWLIGRCSILCTLIFVHSFFILSFASSDSVSARHGQPIMLSAIDSRISCYLQSTQRNEGTEKKTRTEYPSSIDRSYPRFRRFGDKRAAIRIAVASFSVTKRDTIVRTFSCSFSLGRYTVERQRKTRDISCDNGSRWYIKVRRMVTWFFLGRPFVVSSTATTYRVKRTSKPAAYE